MTRPSDSVEPLNTLDEKFIASPLAFEVMRPTCAVVVDGDPLRTTDGSLDRALVLSVVESALLDVPEFRQHLRNAWLGLSTPVWTPPAPVADVDIAHHVRFHPEVVDLATSWDLLTGRHNGPMDRSRPLWDLLVVAIDDGRVGLSLRAHHVIGDGVFLLRVVDGFFGAKRSTQRDSDRDGAKQAAREPRTSVGVLVASARVFASQQPSAGAAWREYSRKPVLDRVRRCGGRLLRPTRFARFGSEHPNGSGLPEVHSLSVSVPFATVRDRARALGATVTAVTVSAALRASGTSLAREEVAMLVPISSPTRGVGSKRNDVSMARVAVRTDTPLAAMAASVSSQIADAVAAGGSGLGPRDWLGYASYLPLRRPARAFGPAPVQSLTLWPVVEPVDEVGVFACSNVDRFTIGITVRTGIDPAAVMASVLETLDVNAEVAS